MSLLKATATAIGGQTVSWLTANQANPRMDYVQLVNYPPVEEIGNPIFSNPSFSNPRAWTVVEVNNDITIYPTDLASNSSDGIWTGSFDSPKKVELYLLGTNLSYEWKYITAKSIAPRGLPNG